MGKILVELLLFAGILWQITLLASYAGYGGTGSYTDKTTNGVTLGSMESLYKSGSYTMNPYEVAPTVANTSILQDLARQEAERIVQTGDYDSFQKRLHQNSTVLNAMGYKY